MEANPRAFKANAREAVKNVYQYRERVPKQLLSVIILIS